MNIVYVATEFPSLSESFILNEISELERKGHDVSVFSIGHSNEKIVHTEVSNLSVDIHSIAHPSYGSIADLIDRTILSKEVLDHLSAFDDPRYHIRCLYLYCHLSSFLDRQDHVDVVHAHFASPERVGVAMAAKERNIPCSVTTHAYELFSPKKERHLARVLNSYDQVIAPCQYNNEYISESLAVNCDVSVVPATASVDKFEPSDSYEAGRLLTVARLVEKKGHEYAIDAVTELVSAGYNIDYHIVGTGDREASLKDQVTQRGIEDHVEFLGNVSDEKLQTELHEAELFILPCVIASNGDRDATPVALKEAMATQTACISTTLAGIPEIITDGEDGRLVEPNNSTALMNAIAELLDDSKKRDALAKSGRQTVQTQFDLSKTVDELVEVFQDMTKRSRSCVVSGRR
ncbi:glycosyltransferase [Haloarcula sp. AONF1]